MNILFISRWFPYPPDNGSKIRVFNLLKYLSRRHTISLLSFTDGETSKARLQGMGSCCQDISTVQYKEFAPTRLKALLGFFSRSPRSIVDTFNHEMEDFVENQVSSDAFDVVVASQLGSAPYALLAKGLPRVLEEVELGVIYQQFAKQRSLLYKVRYGLTWWKWSRFLARLLLKFEACTVVSERERALLMKIAPQHDALEVVPNGADLEADPTGLGTPLRGTLIYTGSLTYRPNFDAVEFFLRDIFPEVKRRHPGVRLGITGNYSGAPLERLALNYATHLTGYLEDVRPAVVRSWACVVPLRLGGGTRLKILEAMALGTPVISTSKGAEGLDVTHEQNILIADKPADFVHAILRVLEDSDLRQKLSVNGRKWVEERYSWQICAARLEGVLNQAVTRFANRQLTGDLR